MNDAAQVDAAFRAHRRLVWGLGYRMLGSAADADDLAQEVFARALARPPADRAAPWRPWLVTVAMNLARDMLRKRKRTPYVGEWLPAPVDGDAGAGELGAELYQPAHEPAHEPRSSEGRYDLMESVSYAFLIALEALSPLQRGALLLCDVFDYSAAEAAAALGLTEGNVRVLCHRARKTMASYDRARRPATAALAERTRRVLEEFLAAIASQDSARAEALLAEDVRDVSDGGGKYLAALKPVLGREKVLRLMLSLAARNAAMGPARLAIRTVNGMPALVMETPDAPKRNAPRFVLRIEIDDASQINAIHSIAHDSKLTAIAPC